MRVIVRKWSYVTRDCAMIFPETDKRYLLILISCVKHGMKRGIYVMGVFEQEASYQVEGRCAAHEDTEK